MKMTTKIAVSVATVVALSTGVYATCASNVDMGAHKIITTATTFNNNELVTKQYVDSAVANPPVTAPAGYEVIYAGGHAWLDRNLGATTACTTVYGDATCHGDLYQWGRPADGHESRTSATQAGPTSYSQPNHGNFITVDTSPYNWVDENIQHFWSVPGSGANGVCPAGWSVPTEQDFKDLSITDSADAFSKLKLTESGYRDSVDGALRSVGSHGYYWTTTVHGEYSRRLHIYAGDAYFYSYDRAYGLSVRCVKR